MRCPHCGQENGENARACIRCGSGLLLPKTPWETDPRVRAAPRSAPTPKPKPSAPPPQPQVRRAPPVAPMQVPSTSLRNVSWADATDIGATAPSKAKLPPRAPRPEVAAPAGPTRTDQDPVERVRTENRSPQPAWDEVIARAPSDVLKRMRTNRAAEAETQVNLRSPLVASASVTGSEDHTMLDHPGPRPPVARPELRSDTEARVSAPSFLDITERQPPSLKKTPEVLKSSPRNASDTLPPFEAPTLQPARPAPSRPAPAPAAKAPVPSRPAPAKPAAPAPPTRVEPTRDATLKGVVMSEAEAELRASRALENAPVQLRGPGGFADDLELPPSRPSEQSASDLAQATMYGVLAPEPPSQSMGGATRVAAKDALAGGGPSRGQVPAHGAAAARLRDAIEVEVEEALPWEVSDPEATPPLQFDHAGRAEAGDFPRRSELSLGDLSLPGEPALGTGLSSVLDAPVDQAGDVRVQASGLGRRWAALFIDTSLVGALVAVPAGLGLFGEALNAKALMSIDGFTGLLRDGELTLPLVVFVALLFFGSLVFRLTLGRTPGELIMRLSLVRSRDAEKPGLVRIVLRSLLGLVSFALAGAGYFFSILDRRSRTLHDVLCGVMMIRGRPTRSAPPAT